MKRLSLALGTILFFGMNPVVHSEPLKVNASDYKSTMQGNPTEWNEENGQMKVTLAQSSGSETKSFSVTPSEATTLKYLFDYAKKKEHTVSLKLDAEGNLQGFAIHSPDQDKSKAPDGGFGPGRLTMIVATKDGSLDPNQINHYPKDRKPGEWVGCVDGTRSKDGQMMCVFLREDAFATLLALEQKGIEEARKLLTPVGPEKSAELVKRIQDDPSEFLKILESDEAKAFLQPEQIAQIKGIADFAIYPLNVQVARKITQGIATGTISDEIKSPGGENPIGMESPKEDKSTHKKEASPELPEALRPRE